VVLFIQWLARHNSAHRAGWIGRWGLDQIIFNASVYKVQTLVDQGLRLTLDLPEDAISAVAKLMEAKRDGVYFRVLMNDQLIGEQLDDKRRKGTVR
jgi:hypothetical protein